MGSPSNVGNDLVLALVKPGCIVLGIAFGYAPAGVRGSSMVAIPPAEQTPACPFENAPASHTLKARAPALQLWVHALTILYNYVDKHAPKARI
eukprot:15470176-Alexandrium_andersonii.AAC.1